MLESSLSDIKEASAGVLACLTQQALWLLRLLQDFLCAEGHGNQELWSEKVGWYWVAFVGSAGYGCSCKNKESGHLGAKGIAQWRTAHNHSAALGCSSPAPVGPGR